TNVASCTVSGTDSNEVLITYAAGGKTMLATSPVGGELIATIVAHAVPGQQVTSPANGGFFTRADTGTNNIHLVANDAVRGQTGGSAPLFYPGICPDGLAQTDLGFCCSLPATAGTCDKRFPCNGDTDCGHGLCCDGSGNCSTVSTCTSNADCDTANGFSCQQPPGGTCLLETCDDGNNVDTDNCSNLCQPKCQVQ